MCALSSTYWFSPGFFSLTCTELPLTGYAYVADVLKPLYIHLVAKKDLSSCTHRLCSWGWQFHSLWRLELFKKVTIAEVILRSIGQLFNGNSCTVTHNSIKLSDQCNKWVTHCYLIGWAALYYFLFETI